MSMSPGAAAVWRPAGPSGTRGGAVGSGVGRLVERFLNHAGRTMTVAGLAGLLFGLGQLAQGWATAERARDWPVVPGEVVQARVESGRDPAARWGAGWAYRPEVVFRYAVDGEAHTGRRAWYGVQPAFADEAAARAALAAFPEGAAVEVRHDPADPSQAALVLAVDWTRGMIWWLGGGVFLLLGLLVKAVARAPG